MASPNTIKLQEERIAARAASMRFVKPGRIEPCRVCQGSVGLIHAGQIKHFCSKACRAKRHNKKA